MGMTPFPHGISSIGIPILGADPVITGDVYWVCSVKGGSWEAGSNSLGNGERSNPFATIDYAVGNCTTNNGDVIYVLPGHTETIAVAGGITADVAGISIIGLGSGAIRPTITWSAVGSTFAISAANVLVKNIITTISIDEVVSMFNITGANCILDKVDFQPYGASGVTGQAIQWLTTGTAAHYLTIQDCRHNQMTAAAANQVWINLNTLTSPRILNNVFQITARANVASHLIGSAAACVSVEIVGNLGCFLGGTITGIITLTTATTGIIAYNVISGGADVDTTTAFVADAAFFAQNYSLDDVAASMILTPAAGTW